MEQKRTLWILLATGIFLLVVLGSAMILCGKSANKCTNGNDLRNDGIIWTTPSSSSLSSANSASAVEEKNTENENAALTENSIEETAVADTPVFENSVVSELSVPEEGKTELAEESAKNMPGTIQTNGFTVISNGTTNIYGYATSPDGTTTIDLNSNSSEQETSVTAKNQVAEKAIQETIAVKNYEDKSAVITDTSKKPETKPVVKTEPKTTATTTASASKASAKTTASSSKNTSTAKSTTSTKTTASKANTSATTSKVPDRFWVQAASFTSKKAADEARAVLDENKIQCEVFTFTDAKGTLYYRVRVGPYTTKSEAEYWKTKIDVIPMFKNNKTYVTNSSAAAK